jgi:hypothetical protein
MNERLGSLLLLLLLLIQVTAPFYEMLLLEPLQNFSHLLVVEVELHGQIFVFYAARP